MDKKKLMSVYSRFCILFAKKVQHGRLDLPFDFSFWSGSHSTKAYIYSKNGSHNIHVDGFGDFCLDPRVNDKLSKSQATESIFWEWLMTEFFKHF